MKGSRMPEIWELDGSSNDGAVRKIQFDAAARGREIFPFRDVSFAGTIKYQQRAGAWLASPS